MKNILQNEAIVVEIAGNYSIVKTENNILIFKLLNLGFYLN